MNSRVREAITTSTKVRVAWFPKAVDLAGNPYWARLQCELKALGVEFEISHNSYWTQRRWLLKNRGKVKVLHFHFIQPHYVGHKGTNERALLSRLLKFAADLVLARLLGYRIVWTMHDLMPTWPREPQWVELFARYIIAWLADDVIVHCQAAKHLLAQRFHRSLRVHVFPHPNYSDAYPHELSTARAREQLQIENESFVVASIGGIRPNKGLEELITAFTKIDDPQAVLLIAGRPYPPEKYVRQIEELSSRESRIILHACDVPETDLQLYIKAADIVALPFKQVLTSGSAILAMSFGRPVIVPRMGCLPELVGDDAGITYEQGDVDGLSKALQQARMADLASMGVVAAQRANAYSWSDLARDTVQVYGI